MTQLFAEVAVNSALPHRQTFSYAVPAGMPARTGHGVYVPFGQRVLQGVVLEVHTTPVFSEPEKIRPVHSLIDDAPLLDAARVELARWIAGYYLAPIFDAVALMLPPGFERRPLTALRSLVDASEVGGLDLPERQRAALERIARGGAIEVSSLGAKFPAGVVGALERRGLVARHYTLERPRVGAQTEVHAALALPPEEARRKVAMLSPRRPSRRAALLTRLIERGKISDDEALRMLGGRPRLERAVSEGLARFDREGHTLMLAMPAVEALAEAETLTLTSRGRQALAVVDRLAAAGEEDEHRLRGESGAERATIDWLIEAGVVTAREVAVRRDPLAHMHVPTRPPVSLTDAQRTAADVVGEAIDARLARPFLLHGVTGSGKTEVYLDALGGCVERGRRAIVLVPEIALTPQTVRRFRERFGRVAVLHSGLTDGERYDEWHGIARGEYDVVIGARSAVFAPQPDLGLVIVDEEHEWTYKQQEAAPRYHARDVALKLGALKDAPVLLGTATPDVATYHRAQRGELRLLSLAERVRPVARADGSLKGIPSLDMPRVTVVDMREELHSGNRAMFSRELQSALDGVLAAGDQAILFLNRRGLAGHVQCRDCGFVPACVSCFVALTYHRQQDRLLCHQCNRQQRMAATCRQCDSPRVRLVGAGVEKVEDEAQRLFPSARLLRWDRDVTRGKHAHEEILARFLAREADILVGTQMLAKGLDLPAVTLVGVVNADIGLHLPDFRAGERTFQLLTQVAGRAGRGERPGRVIVQTYRPDHYAIDAAARYDYEGFAAKELEARKAAGYPPYGRMVRLLFAHTNARFSREEAMRVARLLEQRRAELGADSDVLGPAPAYVARAYGRWRWQILLRGRAPGELAADLTLPAGWTVDVDPASTA